MAESSSLSLQSFETCGSFWLSVASTIAWPTLLAVLSIFYTRITVTYNLNRGGKIEQKTLLGVVDHKFIAPSPVTMQLPTSSTRSRAIPSHYYITHSTSTRTNRSYSWCCCLTGWSTSTARLLRDFDMVLIPWINGVIWICVYCQAAILSATSLG